MPIRSARSSQAWSGGVDFTFSGKRISGILTVLPSTERTFLEDMKEFDFPEAKSLKLKLVMGFDKHRLVTEGTCVSDLSVFGMKYLMDRGCSILRRSML